MYGKRILILQQTDSRFAQRGKELCGLVKLVNGEQTDVTVFVTNAETGVFGQWWILLCFDGEPVAKRLSTLNNDVFSLPRQNLDNVSCLLVKKEDKCYEAAQAQYGVRNNCGTLRRRAAELVGQETADFQQFVEETLSGVDVGRLENQAQARYETVKDYSSAYERFYAAGGMSDYYQTVKKEISRVFLQFPPYYPLIKQYNQSFFVRIDFPNSEKYFVLGVLQEKGVVRYICYGLPAEKREFSDNAFMFVQSTPTNFWMLFQDADTGQITTFKSAT